MAIPWLANQWACNGYGADPGRTGTVDTEALGTPISGRLADWMPDLVPVRNPDGYDAGDWHAILVADWPEVPSTIPADKQTSAANDDKVIVFLERYYGRTVLKSELHCFDRANYQLHLAEFKPSGRPNLDEYSILTIKEYPEGGGYRAEIQLHPTIRAVQLLKESLSAGIPMVIGLQIKFISPMLAAIRPNELQSTPFTEPTNHFVVAVGMGSDGNGPYISYYDYGHRHSDKDRLYLNENLLLLSADGKRFLTEVRRSTAR